MRRKYLKGSIIALAAMAMTTSLQAYSQDNAKRACINKVTEHGTGQYHNPSGIHVTDQGHHSYTVTGNVRSNSDSYSHPFSCNIRHRELVSYNVTRGGGNHKNAAAVGAGILALAVIAAAANNDKHQGHDQGASPFDDMRYLKRQCKQNIRQQIQADHPRRHIDKVRLGNTHLNNRKLRGSGEVVFGNGHTKNLNYNCEYDRRGRIYDGYYHYR